MAEQLPCMQKGLDLNINVNLEPDNPDDIMGNL